MSTEVSAIDLFSKIKGFKGDPKKLDLDDKKAAKGVDWNSADQDKDGMVSDPEFEKYVSLQKTPIEIEFNGIKYKIENGKISKEEQAESTARPVPRDKKTNSPIFDEIKYLFEKIFSGSTIIKVDGSKFNLEEGFLSVMDKDGYIRPDRTDWLIRNKMKRVLAFQLTGSVDNHRFISDSCLDFFFGNQDGKLDKEDKITLSNFVLRLKAYLPQLVTVNSTGTSVAQAILGGEIHYMDFNQMSKSTDNWTTNIFNERNRTGLRLFKAAVRGYIEGALSGAEKKNREEEAEKIWKDKPDFKKINLELRKLILLAAQAMIREQYYIHKGEMKYKIDLSDEKNKDLMRKYTDGIVKRWIETGRLPKIIDRESIIKVYEEYQKKSSKTASTPIPLAAIRQ